MIDWHSRVGPEVSEKINLKTAENTFRRKIKENLKQGMPDNYAYTKARQAMLVLMGKLGIPNASGVHFLHVCEVEPYAGCGCCLHRRRRNYNQYERYYNG